MQYFLVIQMREYFTEGNVLGQETDSEISRFEDRFQPGRPGEVLYHDSMINEFAPGHYKGLFVNRCCDDDICYSCYSVMNCRFYASECNSAGFRTGFSVEETIMSHVMYIDTIRYFRIEQCLPSETEIVEIAVNHDILENIGKFPDRFGNYFRSYSSRVTGGYSDSHFEYLFLD